MKKLIIIVLTVVFVLGVASAADEELYVPIGGDEECWIGYYGDQQLGHFFVGQASGGGGEEGGGGGGGAGEPTCTSEGYLCCDNCLEETNHSMYDDTCEYGEVCCEFCAEDIIDEVVEEEKFGLPFTILPESLMKKLEFTIQEWCYILLALLIILFIIWRMFTKGKRRF